mgnify:CR=1 FL=1
MTSILTGVVIATKDHREHDRFYTLYTRERGKVRILANGTRKFLSKLAPHMTPFCELTVMVAHGKLWLKLASVERRRDFPTVRDNLQLFGLGLSLNELIWRALGDNEPDEQLYDFLLDAYSWIQTLPELSPKRMRFVQSALTLKWLVLIGFGQHCEACVHCRTEAHEVAEPHVTVAHGGLVCGNCYQQRRFEFADARELTPEVLSALRFLARAPFESLLTDRLDPLLEPLTDVQDAFVQYHVERELRVPTFLEHIVT